RMLDLLAVALTAGLPTHTALAAVSDAVAPADPEVAAPLRAAAARVRLGATPAQAWRDIPGAGAVAPAAPVLARATDGGGSVRAALGHAAQRMRSDADAAAVSRAERAAVLVAGPLGLCFLPAFVCLGIVPVVIGLADGMLPGAWPCGARPAPLIPGRRRHPGHQEGECTMNTRITRPARRLHTALLRRFQAIAATDAGMSTVEYAVGTIAAAAFGAVLYTVVSGDSIPDALGGIIEQALNTSV